MACKAIYNDGKELPSAGYLLAEGDGLHARVATIRIRGRSKDKGSTGGMRTAPAWCQGYTAHGNSGGHNGSEACGHG